MKREEPYKINELIKSPVVRVVGENIDPGIYNIREALGLAENLGLDLVEISPTANPPRHTLEQLHGHPTQDR